MKYKLFPCLIFAWIILPLTGKDFIGGPETVPQGWNFHKPDSKTYYFSGRKIVGKHAGKLGIVNDPKEGKIVKLLPSWDFFIKRISNVRHPVFWKSSYTENRKEPMPF